MPGIEIHEMEHYLDATIGDRIVFDLDKLSSVSQACISGTCNEGVERYQN